MRNTDDELTSSLHDDFVLLCQAHAKANHDTYLEKDERLCIVHNIRRQLHSDALDRSQRTGFEAVCARLCHSSRRTTKAEHYLRDLVLPLADRCGDMTSTRIEACSSTDERGDRVSLYYRIGDMKEGEDDQHQPLMKMASWTCTAST